MHLKEQKKILKLEDFKKIVDQVEENLIEIHLYNWGEPTLNKHLIDMLRYAKSKIFGQEFHQISH